jgi:hypothetical protein
MSQPGLKPGASTVGGEHSRKEQSNNSYSEHLHMSARPCSRQCKHFKKFPRRFLKEVQESAPFLNVCEFSWIWEQFSNPALYLLYLIRNQISNKESSRTVCSIP